MSSVEEEFVESSSLYQACYVHTGVNAYMIFSDCVIPTHLQLLCFHAGIMWHMLTHTLGVQAQSSCPAFVSNGLERVFAKECAQESSKMFYAVFPFSGYLNVGIVSCLGKRGGEMKSVTGEIQVLLMLEGRWETTHLLVGQRANGLFNGGLWGWRSGHKCLQRSSLLKYVWVAIVAKIQLVLSSLPLSTNIPYLFCSYTANPHTTFIPPTLTSSHLYLGSRPML